MNDFQQQTKINNKQEHLKILKRQTLDAVKRNNSLLEDHNLLVKENKDLLESSASFAVFVSERKEELAKIEATLTLKEKELVSREKVIEKRERDSNTEITSRFDKAETKLVKIEAETLNSADVLKVKTEEVSKATDQLIEIEATIEARQSTYQGIEHEINEISDELHWGNGELLEMAADILKMKEARKVATATMKAERLNIVKKLQEPLDQLEREQDNIDKQNKDLELRESRVSRMMKTIREKKHLLD